MNRQNDSVRIGNFYCSLAEFAILEPAVSFPADYEEIECCSDKTQRQCIKFSDETISGIPDKLREQLVSLTKNVPQYETKLSDLRTVKPRDIYEGLTLPEVLAIKVSKINAKASELILTKYPQHAQNNMLGEAVAIINSELVAFKSGTKYTLSATEKRVLRDNNTCLSYINGVRAKSNVLCDLVKNCADLESLLNIDILDVKYW